MADKQATFGAGCFWCSEAVFRKLKGIKDIEPGFAGGHIDNPTYADVCNGGTGHVEVIHIKYDDRQVSYRKLLELFWFVHDPTSEDKQGNDVGEQYKSVIFYHNKEQQELAEEYKEKLNKAKVYQRSIVTQIIPLLNYYYAGDNHKEFYENNPDLPYCEFVVRPKVERFEAVFAKNKGEDYWL